MKNIIILIIISGVFAPPPQDHTVPNDNMKYNNKGLHNISGLDHTYGCGTDRCIKIKTLYISDIQHTSCKDEYLQVEFELFPMNTVQAFWPQIRHEFGNSLQPQQIKSPYCERIKR